MGDSADLERSAVENPAIVRETILIRDRFWTRCDATFFFWPQFQVRGMRLVSWDCLYILYCARY